MANSKRGSSEGYISVSSVVVKVRNTEKDRAYREITGAMKSGTSIPGVQYRRVPGGVGWQIRIADSVALEDYAVSRGYIVPYRLPKQNFSSARETERKLAPDVVSHKSKETQRDPFFNIDPNLKIRPAPESYPLIKIDVAQRDESMFDGLSGVLATMSNGEVIGVRELNEKYKLSQDETRTISLVGSAVLSSKEDAFGYSSKDVSRGLMIFEASKLLPYLVDYYSQDIAGSV